jgi:predicted RNA-binding Zn ribbon-like protein
VDQGEAEVRVFDLSGGALCLDFANTLDDRPELHPREFLASYADLLAFTQAANSLPERHLATLQSEAARHSDDAQRALARARGVREAIYRLFLALAEERAAPADDLATLNEVLADALRQARIVPVDRSATGPGAGEADATGIGQGVGQRFGWGWTSDPPHLEAPIWPVVRSAADLLTSPDLTSLRLCASDTCSWLFLDTSRNGSRRWCSMRTCGNRAKARRHHARARAGASAQSAAG